MDNLELRNLVIDLICSKSEGEWWDFKEIHHADKASLLHDILSMANSKLDRDSYIIFGVRDKSFEIIGCNEDSNRRNKQNIVELLRSVRFAGGSDLALIFRL